MILFVSQAINTRKNCSLRSSQFNAQNTEQSQSSYILPIMFVPCKSFSQFASEHQKPFKMSIFIDDVRRYFIVFIGFTPKYPAH